MVTGSETEPRKLTAGVITKYKQRGVEVIKCSWCGREIHVGEKFVRRGKIMTGKRMRRKTLKFYCEECWKKMYLELPEPTEEEIEKMEVLTAPFLALEKVMLCRD